MHANALLAQNQSTGSLMVWGIVLILLLLLGFGAVSAIKRYYAQPDTTPLPGFTLEDLENLHRAGKISDQEFARAREKMIARLKQGSGRGKNATSE